MLADKIVEDLNSALKARNKPKVEALRFLLAAIKTYAIDTYLPGSGGSLRDADVEKILIKQVKQHEESIAAFTKGGRTDLVDKEKQELEILNSYLPSQMTDAEVRNVIVSELAAGKSAFGPLMGKVMQKVAGKASGTRVQKLVKEILGET